MVFKVLDSSQLFGSQVVTNNCVYDIRDVFDLQGNVVVIPDGCVLRFSGGMLTNGTISSNDLTIQAPLTKIFTNVSFVGSFVNGMTFEIEWFVAEYENEFHINSTKDASVELNTAFASGLRKVHFNNDRYFPVRNSIIINGNLDITGETRYLDNASWYLKQPCIYSNSVVNLFTYNFNSNHYQNEPPKTRLNIDGLNFYCAVSYNNQIPVNRDSPTYESQVADVIGNVDLTSIVKIINAGPETLWGLHININITSIFEGGAGVRIPNYTGLELYAQNGSISFVEIWGYVSQVFQAYKFDAGTIQISNPLEDGFITKQLWITDTKIFGNSMCAKGGFFKYGEPVRNYGTHQPISIFPTGKNEAYFVASKFNNYGYIWDLGGQNSINKLWSCKYVAKPVNDVGFVYEGHQDCFSPISLVEPNDLFYPNLLSDACKYNVAGSINVETQIRCFNANGEEVTYSGETVEEHLAFKRYLFPEHLLKPDHMNWFSSQHSDIGFTSSADNSLKYQYKTILSILDPKILMAYMDNPSLYFSPILPDKAFSLRVTYYRKESGSWVESDQSFLYQFNPGGNEQFIGSAFFFGRYYKLQCLFDVNAVAQDCKTIIEYEQEITNNSLICRPVFFIPNYHADKVVRAGTSVDMPVMINQDVGEMFYHTTNGQLWWNGSKWVERDGASAGVRRNGTFAQKPAGGDIYVGFRYFCTSGVTVQNVSMTNIEIFFTGSGWVDALGRSAT